MFIRYIDKSEAQLHFLSSHSQFTKHWTLIADELDEA